MLQYIKEMIGPSFVIATTCGLCYYGYHSIQKLIQMKTKYTKKRNENNNMITIIHTDTSDDTSIGLKTHMDFLKSYEKVDKNKDIHIIIHTTGGELSSAEAICNCIDNHRKQNNEGKIKIYIPYYAYSGGCMIALACDEIIMTCNAILGPCDAQSYVGGVHSVAAIVETVKYKKEMKEKITEEWLAGCYDAELCKDRQQKYVNKLVNSKIFSEDIGKIIYEEFFSGKYNHDRIFPAQDAKDLGLQITIVKEMPKMINDIINYHIV
jgi:ATP-dependent protease ClpP protease subunit